MVFTDFTWKYFSLIPFKIRAAIAKSNCFVPFTYEDESFFKSYEALYQLWAKRQTQKKVAQSLHISKETLKGWQDSFLLYGAIGLLPKLSYVRVDTQMEKLVILIKSCRPHESASLALRLAEALEIPGPSLELIRQIQRCYGYGQRLDQKDVEYYHGLQHALSSVAICMSKKSSARK